MKKSGIVLFAILFSIFHCIGQNQKKLKSENGSKKVDSLITLDIGGVKQVIQIKTDDDKKPILLFLAGGPGGSIMDNAGSFTGILKKKFTLVQWDQRDAGRTLKLNVSPVPPSIELMGKDTYEVIRYLTTTLKQEKIYLLGSSWGNVLGFYIVRNHPELLHAYFAANPVISQLASEKELLEVLKIYFKENDTASKELATIKMPFQTEEDLYYLRKWLFYKDGKKYALGNNFKSFFFRWTKIWWPAWQESMTVDLPNTLKKVDCPVYFLLGKYDIQTSTKIATDYFKQLEAPKKDLFLFEKSGHQIELDEPKEFQNAIIKAVDQNFNFTKY